MTEFRERRCYTCPGTIRLEARAGRTREFRGVTVEIPAALAIPTCDTCGDWLVNAELAEELDEVLLAARPAPEPLPPDEMAGDDVDIDPKYLDPDFGLSPVSYEEWIKKLREGESY